MASWTTPKTYVSGAALTAAELNTDIGAGGSTEWLKDALTTHGITSDSTIGQLKSAAYGVQVFNTSNQSLSNGTTTSLDFPSSESFDSDAFHSTVTNTNRLTIPSGGDGIYLVGYTVDYASNSTGNRRTTFMVNGTPVDWGETRTEANSSNNTVHAGSALWHGATAADYIILQGLQSSGGALNVETAYFWMVRLFAS